MIRKFLFIVGILILSVISVELALAISGSGTNLDVRIDEGDIALSGDDTGSITDFRAEGSDLPAVLASGENTFFRFTVINLSLDIPIFNSVEELDQDNNTVNSTAPIITGENLIVRTNVSSIVEITSVTVSIWGANKNGATALSGTLSSSGGLYTITLPVNYTYTPGIVNYTITANNAMGISKDNDGTIEVYYNTTLTTLNTASVEYGQNITLTAAYNLTNTTASSGATCNFTAGSITGNLGFSNQLYLGSLNSTNFALGNVAINWNCGKLFYVNRTSNTTFTVTDIAAPSLSNIVHSPNVTITSLDNVTINATATDGFLNTVWIESDYTGAFVNYSNSTGHVSKNGNVFSYIVGYGNLSSGQIVQYRWYANDTTNNVARGTLLNFTIVNRQPDAPTLSNPQDGDYVFYQNATLFSWTSSDADADNITYHFQIANSSLFGDGNLTVNTTLTVPGKIGTATGNYTFTAVNELESTYYWRVRATDNGTYTSFSPSRSFILTNAAINISTPYYDEVITGGTTTTITVNETLNGAWVKSMDLIISVDGVNSTVVATNTSNNAEVTTSYTYSYLVPNVNSTFVILKAIGHNGSLSVNTTSRFQITKDLSLVRTASIDYLCGSRAINAPNSQNNFTLRANLGVLIGYVNVNLTYPNGTVTTLSASANNSDSYANTNYSYEYNYSFNFGSNTGVYVLRGEIRDINYPLSSAVGVERNMTVAANANLDLSQDNFNTIEVKDTCTGEILTSGSSITSTFPEGKYDIIVSTSDRKQTVELFKANLSSSSVEVCNFTELDESIAAPTNFRAIDQYEVSCNNNLIFTAVNLTYDYSSIISSVLTESALKLYKCDNVANNTCTWTLVSTNLKSDGNNITGSFTNFSTFMVGEDLSLVQLPSLPTRIITSGGGGVQVGEEPVIIDLLQPGKITFYNNETIMTPIVIKNNGNFTLEDITITAETDSDKLRLSLDTGFINSLSPAEQRELLLTITSLFADPGDHEVRISASIAKPSTVTDSTLFFIDLVSYLENIEGVAEQEMEFLTRLFTQYPECNEFNELSDRAKESFAVADYGKALQFSDAAIQSCKSIVSAEEKTTFNLKKLAELETNQLLLLGGELVVLAFVVVIFYTYYTRRRIRKGRR